MHKYLDIFLTSIKIQLLLTEKFCSVSVSNIYVKFEKSNIVYVLNISWLIFRHLNLEEICNTLSFSSIYKQIIEPTVLPSQLPKFDGFSRPNFRRFFTKTREGGMGGKGRVSPRQRMQNLHIPALYSCIFDPLEFTQCKIIFTCCKQQFKLIIVM